MYPYFRIPSNSPLLLQIFAILSIPAVKTIGLSVSEMYLMHLITSLCPFHQPICLKLPSFNKGTISFSPKSNSDLPSLYTSLISVCSPSAFSIGNYLQGFLFRFFVTKSTGFSSISLKIELISYILILPISSPKSKMKVLLNSS